VSRRPDVPGAGVLIAGAIGVIAVVGFVLVLTVGGTPSDAPGSRVRVVRADSPSGFAVLAGRCRDQRVTSVEVDTADGAPLWRIDSRKGSIERRYLVGAAPPLGFADTTRLAGRPAGTVRAKVSFERDGETSTDTRLVDTGALPEEGGTLAGAAPSCGHHVGLGDAAPLFGVAAALVVAGYVMMLVRFSRKDS
jgi:hypothetical protein